MSETNNKTGLPPSYRKAIAHVREILDLSSRDNNSESCPYALIAYIAMQIKLNGKERR